jgi:hypothetical protein
MLFITIIPEHHSHPHVNGLFLQGRIASNSFQADPSRPLCISYTTLSLPLHKQIWMNFTQNSKWTIALRSIVIYLCNIKEQIIYKGSKENEQDLC